MIKGKNKRENTTRDLCHAVLESRQCSESMKDIFLQEAFCVRNTLICSVVETI